jgi:uncharacterized protein (TIGR02466 family)
MKLSHLNLFPTKIFIADGVLEEEYINSIKDDILNTSIEVKNWQSQPYIHKIIKYKPLVDKVNYLATKVLEEKKYVFDTFEITNMWSNILKKGEFHSPHTHSNNILSGVYYIQSDKTSDIHFYDPRPQADVLSPKKSELNFDNASIWKIDSFKNRIILFPSWLQHYVPTNDTNNLRISISFNIMLKGTVGEPTEFQSANY